MGSPKKPVEVPRALEYKTLGKSLLKESILTLQELASAQSLEKISVLAAFTINLVDTYHFILRDPGLIENTTTQYLVAASVIIVRKYYQQ